jgi:hypothetical protein
MRCERRLCEEWLSLVCVNDVKSRFIIHLSWWTIASEETPIGLGGVGDAREPGTRQTRY